MLRFFRSIIPENFKLFEQHLFSTVFEKYCKNIMENLIYMNSVSMAAPTQINCQFVVKNASSDRSGSTFSLGVYLVCSVSLKTQMTRFLGHYLNMCRSIHTIKSLCLICFQLPAKTRGVLLSSAAAEDCTAVQFRMAEKI